MGKVKTRVQLPDVFDASLVAAARGQLALAATRD